VRSAKSRLACQVPRNLTYDFFLSEDLELLVEELLDVLDELDDDVLDDVEEEPLPVSAAALFL